VKIIIILLVSLGGMVPGLIAEVMAQILHTENIIFTTGIRIEGLLRRPAPDSPGAVIRSARPYSLSQMVDFESSDGSWTMIRTLSFSNKSYKNGILNNLTTSVSVSQDNQASAPNTGNKDRLPAMTNRFAAAPSGMKLGYGLSYYLPINQSFLAYAQVKPPSLKSIFAFKNVFTAPQTMLTTGFHLSLITSTSPAGHDVSLRFSAHVDQKFRPIMSFTINLLPSKR
jgi:hypothetical protein